MGRLGIDGSFAWVVAVLVMLMGGVDAGSLTMTVSPMGINSIASYTWAITLSSTPYTPITLSFPSQVTIFPNTTITVNGVSTNYSLSGTSITISSGISTATPTIVVSNVQNPPSAINTGSFSYSTSADNGTVGAFGKIQYTAGSLASCTWSFSLCTEQTSSDLFVSFTSISNIPSGSAYFLIGFATIWTNSVSKGMGTGVSSSVSCAYSTNGSAYNSGACSVTTNEISFPFTTTSGLPSGTSIVVKISGVNSPPTKTTPTSTSYYTYTTDSSLNKIDVYSSCTISNVCVTNQTSATFSNTTMNVNANYGSPQLVFPNSMAVTIQTSDTIDIYYSPINSLTSCSLFIFYKSGSTTYNLGSPVANTNYVTFTYTSAKNEDYTSSTSIQLTCSAFLLPPSETPATLAFIWKRSSNEYMHLNASVTASATAFNSSKASLSLSSTAMVAASNYTFNFLIGQPLGSSPAFVITFSSDFAVTTPLCTVSIMGMTVSSSSCSFSNSTSKLTINMTTSSSSVPSNSNITFFVQGITNPGSPKSFSLPMSTYYDSSVSTSRVETSLTAFTTTITEIANYPVTLSPSGLTVYSATNIVLSFTTSVTIPTLSTFYVQFPSGVSNISPISNLLMVGSSSIALGSGPTTNVSNCSVTFQSGLEIAKSSVVSITIPLTTPTNIGTYSYVKLIISNNSTTYISCKSSLFLNVNSVNTMDVTITPLNSIAGALSLYNFTIALTIPHNTTFIVQVDIPTDTKFNSANSSCTNCITNLTTSGTSAFYFTANNPNGFNSQSITFTLGTFTNFGYVGTGLAWTVSTKTTSPVNLISSSTTNVTISYTNILTGVLSKTEPYYKNNTSPVKMTFSFTNALSAGDTIILSMTSDVYSPVSSSSVTCSSIYGTCVLDGNTNVTVIKITPNVSSILNNTLFVIVQGLISGGFSSYGFTYNINIYTKTSSGYSKDAGIMVYNVSCGENTANACKRCYNNGSCIDCYVTIGQYLQNNVCVGQCGAVTSYYSYANNATGTCTTCINNCRTCENATYCTSCITSYYLFPDNTCLMSCPTTAGYYKTTGSSSSNLICGACVSNCLECVNGSNSCTRCDNLTVLIGGMCQGACGSTNYYQSNGQCLPCDQSCYNCSGAGAGSCYTCSSNYHRYLTLCVSQCPTGTAVNPSNGNCGCDTPCLTCSTYTSCTACANASYWVLNGACIGSCPIGTYANSGQCITCSSGCVNCTINTCTTCVDGSYLFNNSCYSDCNLISEQYDNSGTTCVLCQSGCDRCASGNCTSCLADYTMSSGQCIKTCILTNSCNLSQQVLPLPGFLALAVWAGITVIIHFIQKKNYLPYSIILLSGIIQFVLILGLLSTVNSSGSARLLATSTAYLGQMKALLGVSIALNYLQNICYLILFIYYIKPLITNPRQIDVISNVVVIVIAVVTNFRFGLIAFSRMFPKPNIYVQNPSKLTPLHYLCGLSLFLDIITVAACGLGLGNAQKLSNTFMLSIDLIIVVVANILITVWFMAGSKPQEYYDDIKKYQIEDNAHNATDQNLPNEKNLSKANMIANESFNFDDLDHTELDDGSFKKLTRDANKTSNEEINKENPHPVTISSKLHDLSDPNPFIDPNFETNLKSKRISKDSKMTASKVSKIALQKGPQMQGKSVDDNITPKRTNSITSDFTKGAINSERKRVQPQKNIVQVSQSQYPDLEEQSAKDPNNVFNSKQRVNKPKKVRETKALTKSIDEPMKLMKKGDKKIGYFQSDAYESNADGEDLQQIIKQKIWQSTIKLQRPSIEAYKDSNEQTGHQQISPSMFNLQNQRLDITDIESDPQE